MTVLIKDEEADRLIRELAQRTGETITEAVKKSVRERLERVPLPPAKAAERRRRLDAIVTKLDALPDLDGRSADEILGYNAEGHFD